MVQALCSAWSVSQYQVQSFLLQRRVLTVTTPIWSPSSPLSLVLTEHIESQLPSEVCLDLFSLTGISSFEFLQPWNHFHIIFVKCSLKACVFLIFFKFLKMKYFFMYTWVVFFPPMILCPQPNVFKWMCAHITHGFQKLRKWEILTSQWLSGGVPQHLQEPPGTGLSSEKPRHTSEALRWSRL